MLGFFVGGALLLVAVVLTQFSTPYLELLNLHPEKPSFVGTL